MSRIAGVINAQEVYTLDEAKARLGLADWAFRKAQRAGLVTHKIGRRKYVRGSDILAFLEQQAKRPTRCPKRSA